MDKLERFLDAPPGTWIRAKRGDTFAKGGRMARMLGSCDTETTESEEFVPERIWDRKKLAKSKFVPAVPKN